MPPPTKFTRPFTLSQSDHDDYYDADEFKSSLVVGLCWVCGRTDEECFCDDFWITEEERYFE